MQRTRWFASGGLLALLLLLSGCVERRLIVRSDPPDVAIYLDGHFEGRTDAAGKLEIPFDWYGTQSLVARKSGHVPQRRSVDLDPPWYQVFPLDLFAELLWPGTIVDEQHSPKVVLKRRGDPSPAQAVALEARQFRADQERRPQ